MSRLLFPLLALAASLSAVACDRGAPASGAAPAPSAQAAGAAQRIELEVTSDGFVPADGKGDVKVKVGQPVTLVVTRKVERTCATEIVVKDYGIQKALPADQPVEVTFTPTKPGPIRYACAMDMIAGQIVAE